ncbi:FAD-dependent oxidoreductase [Alloalcanivorax gelatiniphagus]
MKRIVIVGGGYAGFYAAWRLEKLLKRGEATVTVVDHTPYMTYQPFLPEVAAGSIEARHAVVPLRRHLRRTDIIIGHATRINHAERLVHVRLADNSDLQLAYDEVIVTAGAVTRVFPIPGIPEEAIGLKRIEEAVAVRDAILTALDRASNLAPGPERTRLLTVMFIGAGFAGVEGFAELQSLSRALTKQHPGISPQDLNFHLVDASDRILPEVSRKTSEWVVRFLQRRGAVVHLKTNVVSAVDGVVVLSTGQEIDAGLIVWTAGVAANPVIANRTDLPVDRRGLVVVRPDLRVGTPASVVEHAWAAGDDAAVPDLAVGPDARTVPNAQHAVRQGKRVAKNVVAALRGKRTRDYYHRNLGVVATLGMGAGVFQSGPLVIKGYSAWLMHRGYHVLAIPTWERKLRVLGGWVGSAVLGRDIASLESVQHPRFEFSHGGQPWQAAPRRTAATPSAGSRDDAQID